MKRYHLLAPVLGMALTLAADVAMCADEPAQVPSTAAAQTAVKLISRAERAINGFVAACVARDARALSSVTSSQVRVGTRWMSREPTSAWTQARCLRLAPRTMRVRVSRTSGSFRPMTPIRCSFSTTRSRLKRDHMGSWRWSIEG